MNFLRISAVALVAGCVAPALDGLSSAECAADRDCPNGQVCLAGACGDAPPAPDACLGDACLEGDSGGGGQGGCEAQEEICNGADDDCDGEIDEGVLNACGQCGEPPVEVCDDVDNDCDGETDEGLPICNGSCHIPPEAPCNGIDDDCDGVIDNAPEPEGGCAACLPEEIACDGMDEDCDGVVDDGLLNACGECGDPPAEICNGLDEDCDGTPDNEVAGAGEPCEVGIGACRTVGVRICTADLGSGVEIDLACDAVPGNPRPELCGNGVDDDCDGETDEGFDDQLGLPCEVGRGACHAFGQFVCGPDGAVVCDAVEGQPGPELCDLVDNNCDGQVDETYALDRDPQNCGVCGRRCEAPNATPSCDHGQCGIAACDPGYIDLDQIPANGCECEPGAADEPDALGIDSNCDGVDGTAALSVFVSAAYGNDCQAADGQPDPCPDVTPGAATTPVRTLARSLQLAAERNLGHILLDQGDYTRNTAFVLDRDIALHGGYLYDNLTHAWSRPGGPESTVLRAGRLRAEPAIVVGRGVSVRLDTLQIEAENAAESQSAVAISAQSCAHVELIRSLVIAGAGGAGSPGARAGLAPDNGALGRPGQIGPGGAGGLNPDCLEGTNGGGGGQGTARDEGRAGGHGEPGGAGAAGGEGAVNADTPAISGDDVPPGLPGEPGVPGDAGGQIALSGAWIAHGGTPPQAGVNGGGGGGGGGGIGGSIFPGLPGPGGGGGGSGACGGRPGHNGGGGGASIGVLVVGQCLVRLESSEIRAGQGGAGAPGSPGTAGARGRQGGPPDTSFATGPDEAPAAAGGRGGDGGCGGNGAGGSGGPSVGILRAQGAPLPELDPTSFVGVGAGGPPGAGASSGCRVPSLQAPEGSFGLATELGCCLDQATCGADLRCDDI